MNIFNRYPVLIAEIDNNLSEFVKQEGISYIDAAKFVIDEAKDCGITAVEFSSFESSSFDFSIEEYRKLAQYCKDTGMIFLMSLSDFQSVDLLDEFMNMFKIESSDLTNIPFIKYVASKNKPILLSTGGSTIREIKEAVSTIEEVSTVDIAIFHCVLSFPTAYEDANLLMIKDLSENFSDYEIGYSDHTVPDENMAVLTTAYNYGATILEKHFTIDKSLPGSSEHAMDCDDVIRFNWNVNFLSKINGMKNKQPLICESSSRKEMRRSIVAFRDIKKDEKIDNDDLTFKSPGTGIYPSEIDNVVGKIAKENIKKGTLIDFNMLK
ncbi:MAG: N-acetylneuraminate synthase family protein [Methanobrevibacter sp.]|uniref:N-acetylneuraminate synthase family protein n=1 Tax=Methanobrevibacter sp. TaxID=66852 RepID=UPI001B3F813F|nr:N-acetylneuraminate synthase family protein [Methanobrevibacter sp.]MBP3791885.1 N-acetylneuraminate synthase family protein [Methanobrevibacter sp.]